MEEKGCFTIRKRNRVREEVIVDNQLNIDLAEVDQKELLKNVTCPVLIFHGNNDENEFQLYERSKTAIKLLSEDSKLIIIDGAGHSFAAQYDEVLELTVEWFLKYLN